MCVVLTVDVVAVRLQEVLDGRQLLAPDDLDHERLIQTLEVLAHHDLVPVRLLHDVLQTVFLEVDRKTQRSMTRCLLQLCKNDCQMTDIPNFKYHWFIGSATSHLLPSVIEWCREGAGGARESGFRTFMVNRPPSLGYCDWWITFHTCNNNTCDITSQCHILHFSKTFWW